MGWHPSWRFHQPELEEILEARLADWPSVRVRTGARIEAVGQDEDSAILDIDTGERLRADWVIGCDGARSVVRRAIGGGMEDLGFHERWLVIDVLLERERPDLGDHTLQYCHPSHPATYVRGPGPRRRWEIALDDAESEEAALDPVSIEARLGQWLRPGDATIERAAVYTFHSVLARRWRDRRLLIAGDAAHQTPPFMGQGMCAGLRDAANLGWKLAAVVEGATTELLDSYQSERAPNARAYIEGAIRLGRLINASDPAEALSTAFRQADGSYRMASLDVGLGPGLHHGNGRLFPQLRLADGRRMDDVIGYRPALLSRIPCDGAFLTAADLPDLSRTLDKMECAAVMLRPDGVIFATGDDGSELIARYNSAVAGDQAGMPASRIAPSSGR